MWSVGVDRLTNLLILGSLKVGALVTLVNGLKSIIILGFVGTANKAIVFLGFILVSERIPASHLLLINGRFFLGVYLLTWMLAGRKFFAPFEIMLFTTLSVVCTLGREPTDMGDRFRTSIRPSLFGRKSKYLSILLLCAGEEMTTGRTSRTTEDSVGVGVPIAVPLLLSTASLRRRKWFICSCRIGSIRGGGEGLRPTTRPLDYRWGEGDPGQ